MGDHVVGIGYALNADDWRGIVLRALSDEPGASNLLESCREIVTSGVVMDVRHGERHYVGGSVPEVTVEFADGDPANHLRLTVRLSEWSNGWAADSVMWGSET